MKNIFVLGVLVIMPACAVMSLSSLEIDFKNQGRMRDANGNYMDDKAMEEWFGNINRENRENHGNDKATERDRNRN